MLSSHFTAFSLLLFSLLFLHVSSSSAANAGIKGEPQLMKRSYSPGGSWHPEGYFADPNELAYMTQNLNLRVNTNDQGEGSSGRRRRPSRQAETSEPQSARIHRSRHVEEVEPSGARTARPRRPRNQQGEASGSQPVQYQGVFPFLSSGQPVTNEDMAQYQQYLHQQQMQQQEQQQEQQQNAGYGGGFPVLSTGGRAHGQNFSQMQGDHGDLQVDPNYQLQVDRRLIKEMKMWNNDEYYFHEYMYARCQLQDRNNMDLDQADWQRSLAERNERSMGIRADYCRKGLHYIGMIRDHLRKKGKGKAAAMGDKAEYNFLKIWLSCEQNIQIDQEYLLEMIVRNEPVYKEAKAVWEHFKDVPWDAA